MPVKNIITGDMMPTMDDLRQGSAAAVSSAISATRSRAKIDTHLINYADAPFTAQVELKSALYNRADPYIPPFDVVVDSVSMLVLSRKLDGTNIRQFPVTFIPATTALTWLAASVLILKFDFYTAAGADQGKAKLSIGTEAQFTGGTQEIWKSTQAILDATLLTAYAGSDLAVDLIGGRCIFRAAL